MAQRYLEGDDRVKWGMICADAPRLLEEEDSEQGHAMRRSVWSLLLSLSPSEAKPLFLKFPDTLATRVHCVTMMREWPIEAQKEFLVAAGEKFDATLLVPMWDKDAQIQYYDTAIVHRVVKTIVTMDHVEFQTHNGSQQVYAGALIHRAFFYCHYRLPDGIAPPECVDATNGHVLELGFRVYHKMCGVHEKMDAGFFNKIMTAVIERVCKRDE